MRLDTLIGRRVVLTQMKRNRVRELDVGNGQGDCGAKTHADGAAARLVGCPALPTVLRFSRARVGVADHGVGFELSQVVTRDVLHHRHHRRNGTAMRTLPDGERGVAHESNGMQKNAK